MPKPDHEEGGAFQDELPGMGRPREPVEQALGAVAEEDELEVLAALARDVVGPSRQGLQVGAHHRGDAVGFGGL